MNLQLNRPICFFDLETTGTNISKDRIVEISIHKVFPNGEEKTFNFKVKTKTFPPGIEPELFPAKP